MWQNKILSGFYSEQNFIISFLRGIFVHLLHKIPSQKFFQFYFNNFNATNCGAIISLHRTVKRENKKPHANDFIEISPGHLEQVILQLKSLQSRFVTLKELEKLKSEKQTDKPVVHFSFDDGYADNFTEAFEILQKHNIPFSIFLVSSYISNDKPFLWWYALQNLIESRRSLDFSKYGFTVTGADYSKHPSAVIFERARKFIIDHIDADPDYFKEQFAAATCTGDKPLPKTLSWKMVNTMLDSGLCEIGAHTRTHARFATLSSSQKKEEIAACRKDIEANTGRNVTSFAYPYGGYEDIGDPEGISDIMQESGIAMAFTTEQKELNIDSDPFLLPRVFLNNSSTFYTLKTMLTGAYQRENLPGL